MSSDREGRHLALPTSLPYMPNELFQKGVLLWHLKTKRKNEQKFEYALNEVANVKQWEDGAITFSAMVNGIWIYNLRIVETKDDWFISFPARKGSDGKYWKHVYFPIDEDIKKLVEAAVNKALEK